MWLGISVGVLYATLGFGPCGTPARLNITWGPFQDGHLILADYHVHHWLIYGMIVAPVAAVTGCTNITSFAVVMTVHGLSYKDRFNWTPTCRSPAGVS